MVKATPEHRVKTDILVLLEKRDGRAHRALRVLLDRWETLGHKAKLDQMERQALVCARTRRW